MATIKIHPKAKEAKTAASEEIAGQVTGQVTGQVSPEVMKMLEVMSGEMTRAEIQNALKLKGRANFQDRYLRPALMSNAVEMTIPDKPNSRLQKYRITSAGRKMLETKK